MARHDEGKKEVDEGEVRRVSEGKQKTGMEKT